MRRIDIETKLHCDRAWLLDTYAGLSEERLHRGLTPSEHDAANFWSAIDHLAHLSLVPYWLIALSAGQHLARAQAEWAVESLELLELHSRAKVRNEKARNE